VPCEGRPPFSSILVLTLIVSCSLKRSDDAIATDVKGQFYSDQQLQGTLPTVAVSKGVVTLSGALPSDSARMEAYKVASDIRGVSIVVDQMTAQAAPPPTQKQSPTLRSTFFHYSAKTTSPG
jgi:hypothetical protein